MNLKPCMFALSGRDGLALKRNALWITPMKKKQRSASGHLDKSGQGSGAKSKRPKKAAPSAQLALVVVETRKCLSMLRRVVRKSALPEVPDIPCGPFLN
jgi:hypothetical protein